MIYYNLHECSFGWWGRLYRELHAALSLLDAGHSVHIIDDLSTGNQRLIPKNASFTRCNINDEISNFGAYKI